MAAIHVLTEDTINKIAAGEVVVRPAGVVKELIENAIDAGATSITTEIKDGGISLIRVTDNGAGMDKEDIPLAFMRHATSKIEDSNDLLDIGTLGFRGEALSSIAAVAQVELMTKSADSVIGYRYVIEGSKEIELKDIGVPGGTTVIVHNLFYNTPARRKFLKSAITEAGAVAEVMEHLALANPDVAFKFINAGQVKFHTSGNGDVKELIYRLFGKDAATALVPIESELSGIGIRGYLGKPELNRSTRNYENYFVNGRYIKSDVISRAIEEGYREYLMQHRFPFCVLYIDIRRTDVDVNVHPNKIEVRFSDNNAISDHISSAVSSTLRVQEMIPETVLVKEEDPVTDKEPAPEPFEENRMARVLNESAIDIRRVLGTPVPGLQPYPDTPAPEPDKNVIKAGDAVIVDTSVQMEMFDDKILTADAMAEYNIIGQIFDTYWLFTYKDKLMLMDQHAAHEKVKYEKLIAQIRNKDVVKQTVAPAIVITLSPTELNVLKDYKQNLEDVGFDIEEFGGSDISLRAIPMDLYGNEPKELFLDILDEMCEGRLSGVPEVINDKIASMACKSAVKGNMHMNEAEVRQLLKDMLSLDNPYNCPHGRPTIISMTKYELEKRFKRIV